MRESVHDNWIYAQAVDHERRRIVLHTVYPHVEPSEYTDVVFEGVVVHHFEQQRLGSGSEAANILFDVEETDSFFVLRSYETLLVSTRDYGWPVLRYMRGTSGWSSTGRSTTMALVAPAARVSATKRS